MTTREDELKLYLDIALAEPCTARHDLLESLFCSAVAMVHINYIGCFMQALTFMGYKVEQTLRSHERPATIGFFNTDLKPFLDSLLPDLPERNVCSQVLHKYLEPLRSLSCQDIEQKLIRLGHAWIAICKALLCILVPNVAIDPIAIHNATALLQQRECDHISSEIWLHQLLGEIVTGKSSNTILSILHHRLRAAAENKVITISVTGRDNINTLHAYWSEVWQFRDQVVNESRISDLLHSLASMDESAVRRVQVLQGSIAGFVQRLDSMYPNFGDLSALIKQAVFPLRLGFHLIMKAHSIKKNATKTIATLVRYPSIFEHPEDSINSTSSTIAVFDLIYRDLVDLGLQASSKVKLRYLLPRLERLYDQAVGLWLIDKARDAELEVSSQSLYRGSITEHNSVTDAELEEQEFFALFPSFEEPLSHKSNQIKEKGQGRRGSIHDITQLCWFHINLFTNPMTLSEGLRNVDQVRRRLLAESLGNLIHNLPDSLDTMALAYRLRFVNNSLDETQSPIEKQLYYDFYRDANVPELRSATKVITDMRTSLLSILAEWPDQMVLQHLIDRCDAILTLSLRSPIAKVLSVLEQLLLQTDDWEMFANRDNSLASYRQALRDLIIRWRRLELVCWNSLLESEARTFAQGASEWWFTLHNVLCRGLMDALMSNEEETYIRRLIPLIDEFISSSPLGQFNIRLQLLESFVLYLSELLQIKSGPEEKCLRRVLSIVHSIHQFYRLHQPQIQQYLNDRRAVLEKEIQAFIKLASWKDTNVQALKQSAQTTHYQLYKVIRKLRGVLREAITFRLDIKTTIALEVPAIIHVSSQQFGNSQLAALDGITMSVGGLHLNVGAALRKFVHVVSGKIVPLLSGQSDNQADDLAISIITTSKQLAEIPIPSSLPAEKRRKLLKSILARKRKAFSDLLKELKRNGLSGKIKPEVLRQNSDILWLRGQPIPRNVFPDSDVEKSEVYFSSLFASLPELRASLSGHHNDLQIRELQRGLSFLESGYCMAIDLRAR